MTIKGVYRDPETVLTEVGGHTAYVERTNLTSRQMNGRLVRKTISFSKTVEMLEAASTWRRHCLQHEPSQNVGLGGQRQSTLLETLHSDNGRRSDGSSLDR